MINRYAIGARRQLWLAVGTIGLAAMLTGCLGAQSGSGPAGGSQQSSTESGNSGNVEAADGDQPGESIDIDSTDKSLVAGDPSDVKPPNEENGLPPAVKRIETTDRVVFLTIDDGSIKDPRVQTILANRGIPVTAFLTKNAVESNTAYFADVSKSDGQTIQNHSISHPQLPGLSEAGQKEQICSTSAQFADWFGQRPWILRPPYGEFNETTQRVAKECGIDYLALWSVSLPRAELRYAQGDSLRPGDIILTHWRPALYKHLPQALADISRQGFKVAALQNYLPRRNS